MAVPVAAVAASGDGSGVGEIPLTCGLGWLLGAAQLLPSFF